MNEQKPEAVNYTASEQSTLNVGLGLLDRLREWAEWSDSNSEHDLAILLESAANEIDRLRGLFEDPLRVISVEAIMEATGCPDIVCSDGKYLTDKLLEKAKRLLVSPNV